MDLESAMAGIFVPDILTPGQYYDGLRTDARACPVKRLMLAVLADAVRCYETYIDARSRAQRRLFVEAETWLMDRKADGAFAFETICQTLGIDANYLREGLRRRRLKELNGNNSRRLTRRSPAAGSGRIGAPLERRRRKPLKDADGCKAGLIADRGFAVAVNGSSKGGAVAYRAGAGVPEEPGYNQRTAVENINAAADADVDNSNLNAQSWIAVPEVAPVASLSAGPKPFDQIHLGGEQDIATA